MELAFRDLGLGSEHVDYQAAWVRYVFDDPQGKA